MGNTSPSIPIWHCAYLISEACSIFDSVIILYVCQGSVLRGFLFRGPRHISFYTVSVYAIGFILLNIKHMLM